MKKWILFLLAMVLMVTGCTKDSTESLSFELSYEDTVIANEAQIKVSSNADYVLVNGVKNEVFNELRVDVKKGENVIILTAVKQVGSDTAESSKTITIVREEVKDFTGGLTINKTSSILYPAKGDLYNAEKLGVSEIIKAPSRALMRDVSDQTISGGVLTGIVADSGDLVGGTDLWVVGNAAEIYVLLNGEVVEQITAGVSVTAGTGAQAVVQFQENTGVDTDHIITIGNGDGTGLGTTKAYPLNEGANTIAILAHNITLDKYVLIGTAGSETDFTVDTVRPILVISSPVNNGQLGYLVANSTANEKQTLNLDITAQDDNGVSLWGVITKEEDILTVAEIKIDRNQLLDDQAGDAHYTVADDTLIEVDSANIVVVGDDTAVGYTGAGEYDNADDTDDTFIILAEDSNGNTSVTRTVVSKYVVGTVDETNLKLKSTTDTQYKQYAASTEITTTSINVQYYVPANAKGSTVSIIRTVVEGGLPVEKEAVLTVNAQDSRLYEGTIDLVADLEYLASYFVTNAAGANMNWTLKVVHPGGTAESALAVKYVDLDELLSQIVISEDDIEFYTAGDVLVPVFADSGKDGIYFADGITAIAYIKILNQDSEFTVTTDLDSEKVRLGTGKYTFSTSKDLSKTKPKMTMKIYLGTDTTNDPVATFDVVVLDDYDGDITLTSSTIKQNTGEFEIIGEIVIPTNVVSPTNYYKLKTVLTNNSAATKDLYTSAGVVYDTEAIGGVVTFTAATEFDYASGTNSTLDILKVTLEDKNGVLVSTAATFDLDALPLSDTITAYKLQIADLEDDATNWVLAQDSNVITIDNMASFASVTLYLDDVEETGFTSGDSVDLSSASEIKLLGLITGTTTTYVERVITLADVDAASKPVITNALLKEENGKLILTGKVTNYQNTTIEMVNPAGVNVSYTSSGSFISDDLGITREGTEFDVEVKVIRNTDGVVVTQLVEELRVFDNYAPTEGSDTTAHEVFPTGWDTGITATNQIYEFYLINDAGTAKLYGDSNDVLYADAGGVFYDGIKLADADETLTVDTIDLTFGYADKADLTKGYLALVKNYKGSSDYILGKIPESEFDGDYGVVATAEDVIVVIEGDGNLITEITIDKTDVGVDRGFVYDIGDNEYADIVVYLKDEHENVTSENSFTNTNAVPIVDDGTAATAEIVEGTDINYPRTIVKVNQVTNLSQTTLTVKSSAGVTVGQKLNQDLDAGDVELPVSGFAAGEKIYLEVQDKYGNTEFSPGKSQIELTIGDKLPPVLPSLSVITATANADSDTLSGAAGSVEGLVELIFINTSVASSATLAEMKAAAIATGISDADGSFSVEIPRDSANATLKMLLADSAGNTTNESSFSRSLNVSSKVQTDYTEVISSNPTVTNSGVYGISDTFTVNWNAITTDLDHYMVRFEVDGAEVMNVEVTGATSYEVTDVMDILGSERDLTEVTIKVSGVSIYGLEGDNKFIKVKVDTKAPEITAIDEALVATFTATDNLVIGSGAIDTTGQISDLADDTLYVVVYDTSDVELTRKEWSNSGIAIIGLGDIVADQTLNVKIEDYAGNVSGSISVVSSDNEAPLGANLRIVGSIVNNGVDEMYLNIRYIGEDNITIVAYDDDGSGTPVQLGYIYLPTAGASKQMTIYNSVDPTAVYLKLIDSSSPENETAAGSYVQLSTVTTE